MKPLPILIRKSNLSSLQKVAGWLPTSSAKEWVREATQWKKVANAEVFIIPISVSDQLLGAILIPDQLEKPYESKRIIPLVLLAEKILSLEGAELSVSILENERGYLLPNELYFYLPSSGLISINADQHLLPSAFILPTRSVTQWDIARPGFVKPPKLTSIVVPLLEDDFGMENEEGIGELSDQKIKDDPEGGKMGKVGKALGMGAAGLGALPILGISKVRDMLPEGNRTEKNTLDKMEDWAKKNFQNITDARQRELNKLMELMEKNPEEGLKYALPLSGHEERRGNAPAGWQLGQRQLTLGSNRGGGAADGWDMDYQTQITLQNQYRKSAREAEEKKKYDRAAYIYGELLGDWVNAARVLNLAGKFQQAVGIYLHKLHDKARAAQCLEEAGQYYKAIEIYLQTQQYEKAGDLFKKLGSEEKAQEMWEKELDNMTDPILQANLLKSKINSFERACQVLDEAWRQRKKPDKCLGMLFFDYYEREMELESLALINDVFTESVLPTQEKAKLGYKLITKNYFQSVTEKSREEILTLTSSSLVSNEESNNSKYLLKLLPDLAKSDQLLDRDAKRFSVSKSPIKQTLTSDFSGEFSSTYTRSIDTVGSWSSLANLGRQVSIAGSSQDLLTVAMLENKRCLSSQLRLTDYTGENDNIFHLGLLSSTGAKARIFYMQDSKKMHFRSLNKKRTSKHESIGSFQQVLAIGNSGSSNFFFLNYNQSGALLLNEYDINADLLDSVAIDIAPPEVLGAYWSCAGKDGHVCVAVGQAALWRFPDGQYAGIQLHEPIHKISFSPTTYQTAALISGEHEIALVTPKKSGKNPEFINLYSSTSGESPIATFTNNGRIVIIDRFLGVVYKTDQLSAPIATFSYSADEGRPTDICANGPRGFVILTEKAKLIAFD